MNFWEGFWQLPTWFSMSFLAVLEFGILFVVWELAHRKMSITKEGITFDRLSTRRGILWQWFKNRSQKKEKIKVTDI